MHIGHIVPVDLPTNKALLKYGGTERVAADLTAALAALGHRVTLFGPRGTAVEGSDFVEVTTAPLCSLASCKDLDVRATMRKLAAHRAVRLMRAAGVDAVINHMPDAIGAYEQWKADHPGSRVPPMLTVAHNPLDPSMSGGHFTAIYRKYPQHPLVTISNGQRLQHPGGLRHLATIPHGIETRGHRFGTGQGGYLLFLARMAKEKGPHRAIAIAKATGMPLVLAGNVDTDHRAFFDAAVAPHIDNDLIQFVGEVGGKRKESLLQNAAALLAPLGDWPEPFGLYLVEAMLAGTPVITKRNPRSSTGQIVEHGTTGFVVDTLDEFIEAAGRISEIDRMACRRRVLEHFSKERMARDYAAALSALIAQQVFAYGGHAGSRPIAV